MKTFKKCGLALAIAAALVMTMASCSSENELTETPNAEQPEQPTAKGVKITVSAGIADDATTRSEVATEDGKRVLKFTTGDRLYVYGKIDASTAVAGLLIMDGTPTNSNKSAAFTGTIKAYDNSGAEISYDFGNNDPLALCTYKTAKATLVHKDLNTNAISITLGKDAELYTGYMYAADVNTLMTTGLPVQGDYVSGTGFTLSSERPIINCTLTGLTPGTTYDIGLFYETPSVWLQSFWYDGFTADANGAISVAFVSQHSGTENWRITVGFPSDNYYIDLGNDRELTAKVYNVTRHWTGNCFAKLVSGSVSLASVTDNIVALDGATLSGMLANNVKISIAAGATVTLDGVTINDNGNVTDNNIASDSHKGCIWTSGNYAGLTCLGSATIILKDGSTNTVRGFGSSYPGIQAGPSGTTLTIRGGSQGTGQLFASSSGGAGIGSANSGTSGNITIASGTINAASYVGAGIGTGYNFSTCGNISITGGTVTAKCYNTQGGAGIGSCYYDTTSGNISISGSPTVNATGNLYGAGIGSGGNSNQNYANTCGDINITLTGGSVTAKGGQYAAGIGAGSSGTCGTITISLTGGSVTAKGGEGGAAGIGTGISGTCGSISVDHATGSIPRVTVTADRNNGQGGSSVYDIGKGYLGTIKDGNNDGTVYVGHPVITSNQRPYQGNSTDGYNHD